VIGAVDIGGTKIAAGIVDDTGKVLSRVETPTSRAVVYSDGLAHMVRMLREAANATGVKLTGIGIGSTGWVFPFTGEFGDVDFLPGWKGCNPVQDLQREFGVKAAVENDGDAAALGEAGWGAGKGVARLIYVTVGTGIGGGIILDGKLYRGADRAHPEVGHHVIDASGPQCTCGFRGCWEALATGPAMAAWYHEQATTRRPTETSGQSDTKSQTNLSAKEVFKLATSGDPLAKKAVEREHYYLGLGVANLINLFMPEMIVLGGSVLKSAELDAIARVVASGCRFVPYRATRLAHASLGENANLIGAARVWHHRFAQSAGQTF
jgi:glucokinase